MTSESPAGHIAPGGDGDAHLANPDAAVNPRPRKRQVLRWFPDRYVVTTGNPAGNALYLTFDDGPHPEHTPRLLDLLARHGARATFFLIGANAERHSQLARRIAEEGHVLGNHSWNHPHFDRIARRERLQQIARTNDLLASLDGQARRDFRPPRGATTPGLLLDCVTHGIRLAYWSYDSLDYSQRAPEDLLANIAAHPVRAGEVVLMHDDSPHSLVMLEALLPQWRKHGLSFKALRAPQAGDAATHRQDSGARP